MKFKYPLADECGTVLKRNEILTYATIRRSLEEIMLSKITQSLNHKYCTDYMYRS
jgi:hypothetical protein